MKKLIVFFFMAVSLQSCLDIKDEYLYGDDEDAFANLYTIDWKAAADSSTNVLLTHFWDKNQNYFFYNSDNPAASDSWQYWPQAHAMDVVIDAYLRTKDNKYSAYFDKWYEGIKVKNGNTYQNYYYDDMQWNALTMLRIYDITKDRKYLDTAVELWNDIKNGWNDNQGGGISWNKGEPYAKLACSNGPACLIAIKLFKITGDANYKQWAINIYEWERTTLFRPATGALYDGVNIDKNGNATVNTVSLTYNLGTFVGSGVGLYQVTGEKIYLSDAIRAANFTITSPSVVNTADNILRNEGDGDGGLFKGIFIRYFVDLINTPDLDADLKGKYLYFLNHNAQTVWRLGNYKEYVFFGPSWNAPVYTTQLSSQTSGCTLIEARALFTVEK